MRDEDIAVAGPAARVNGDSIHFCAPGRSGVAQGKMYTVPVFPYEWRDAVLLPRQLGKLWRTRCSAVPS